MSHVETCKVTFSNIQAVKAACEKLGLTFLEGKKTYAWWGNHVGDYPLTDEMKAAGVTPATLGKCEHAIKVPGAAYEVGLWPVKDKPGVFLPLYDFYGSGGQPLQRALCKQNPNGTYSKGLEKLADSYSLEVLKAKARAKGYQFQEKTVNGVIKLVVTLGN